MVGNNKSCGINYSLLRVVLSTSIYFFLNSLTRLMGPYLSLHLRGRWPMLLGTFMFEAICNQLSKGLVTSSPFNFPNNEQAQTNSKPSLPTHYIRSLVYSKCALLQLKISLVIVNFSLQISNCNGFLSLIDHRKYRMGKARSQRKSLYW